MKLTTIWDNSTRKEKEEYNLFIRLNNIRLPAQHAVKDHKTKSITLWTELPRPRRRREKQ